jgi:hypothetical protein
MLKDGGRQLAARLPAADLLQLMHLCVIAAISWRPGGEKA